MANENLMMKAILELPIPDNCYECDLSDTGNNPECGDWCYNGNLQIDAYTNHRHPDCPLKIQKIKELCVCEKCGCYVLKLESEPPLCMECERDLRMELVKRYGYTNFQDYRIRGQDNG